MRILLINLILLSSYGAAQEASGVFPASNEDEPGATAGARPYEMDWANRREPAHPQLVNFEDLTGWRVRCNNGAEAKVYRSKQERIFGEYTCKAVYSGKSAASSFVIEPPEPIAIPGPFTAVDLWVRGNNWGWIEPPTTARVGIRVLVRDAKNEEYRIDLGAEDFDYWFLMHATCVSPDGKKRLYEPLGAKNDGIIDFPARFIGLEISGCSNKTPARLYFDALSFYEMQYPPLKFAPAPEKLPWPTTPDTILPSFTNKEPCAFTMTPVDGTLSGLTASIRGQKFQPCYKGSIVFDLGGKEVRPGDPGVTTTLVKESPVDGKQSYEWELKTGETAVRYSYTIAKKNNSYIIDVASEGGAATGFDIGLAKGLENPKTVFVPYLTYGNDWPKVVCANGKGGPIFLLSVLDYYNSDASELFGTPRINDKESLGYTGGALYNPKTDGKRNALHERLFVNVSGEFHDVLPNIPNPDSDTINVAKDYLWRNIGAVFQNEMLSRYKAYGIDKFIACHHEVGWREAGESFTMRDRPAPSIGDDKLAAYGAFVRGLGYRFGTYTNYVDYAPVNGNWDENNVCLNSDGTWQKAWPRNYALKPLRAVEKEAYYAPRIHERYGTTAQYCDVQTAYTPWGRTDYDARTPGAGMFKTQFNSFARLLQNESIAHHGPVFSEGNYQWFYAGIVDGDYATIVPYGRGWEFPPIVDFDLLKMHTKMTDFGMGAPCMYYGFKGEWLKDKSRLSPWFDRFITATVAFGHIGYLPDEWGFDGTLKAYYMLHALQQRYAGVPVKSIRYFDGEKLIDTSTAIATDAYKRGQICTEYENGLTTWCNLSFKDDWKVTVDKCTYNLKPASFLACKPDDILACSASGGDNRHDLALCSDYLYIDTRDHLVRAAPIQHYPEGDGFDHGFCVTTSGCVAIKRDGKNDCWIIPAPHCEEVTLSKRWLGAEPDAVFSATGYNEAGQETGQAVTHEGVNEVTVCPLQDKVTAKYKLQSVHKVQARTVNDVDIFAQPYATKEAGCHLGIDVGQDDKTQLKSVQLRWDGQPKPKVYGVDAPLKYDHREPSKNSLLVSAPSFPDDARFYKRSWLEITGLTAEGGALWDYWTGIELRPAIDIEFPSGVISRHPGKDCNFETKITVYGLSFRQWTTIKASVDVATRLESKGFGLQPIEQTLSVPPWDPVGIAKWTIPLPLSPVVGSISIAASQGKFHCESSRYIRVSPTPWVVANLAKTPFDRGQCLRGSAEAPYDPEGTAATVEVASDALAGETRDTLFTHPPYRKGVGYCFATFDVALPEGHPKLEFFLGFRAGCTTHDGCTFKVVAVDNGKETEVFSDNYAKLDQWARRTADLSAFAGKSIKLKLVTDVGPKDDSYSDWALWGDPKVVMDEAAYKVEILPEKPKESFLPPPEPLQNLTRADLGKIASAKLTLDTAGVNGGQYTSYVYFNGIKIGATPESDSDTDFKPRELALTKEAIATIGPVNTVVIKNPGQDFMKVRSFCLHFTLADGRRGSSAVDIGPYTSGSGWKFEEGKSVPCGDDLPEVVLCIPLK